jgi:hypothetical protein
LPSPPALLFASVADDAQSTTTDGLAATLAQSLDDVAPPDGTAARSVAGGLVTVLPAPTALETPKKVSSLDDDFSNWGNEGLW